jgi:hypothetical protein
VVQPESLLDRRQIYPCRASPAPGTPPECFAITVWRSVAKLIVTLCYPQLVVFFMVGIGRCLTTLSPPRNRACDFHRTRLLGFVNRLQSPSLKLGFPCSDCFRLPDKLVSNFSQPCRAFTVAVSEVSCSTSALFRDWHKPYPPGYDFPLSFDRRPLLFGASYSR